MKRRLAACVVVAAAACSRATPAGAGRAGEARVTALGVAATAAAAAGRLDEAAWWADAAARGVGATGDRAIALRAKVHALRGELGEAERLYRAALAAAPVGRRPVWRAALAAVLLENGRVDDARAAVSACAPGGKTAASAPCLFVAALADASLTDRAVAALDATDPELAALLRARALVDAAPTVTEEIAARAEVAMAGSSTASLAFDLPMLASYDVRLRAQIRTLVGDDATAVELLAAYAARRPADAAVLLQLAMARARTGDRAGALRDVQKLEAAWSHADATAGYVEKARALERSLTTL